LEQFSEAKIADPRVPDLARRVEVIVDPDVDRWYPERYANKVEVVLKNGRRFETRIDFARGSVERPMAFPEVAEKFRSLAGYAVTAEQAERIIEAGERTEGWMMSMNSRGCSDNHFITAVRPADILTVVVCEGQGVSCGRKRNFPARSCGGGRARGFSSGNGTCPRIPS
jgi:hypothetical protein